MARNRMRRRWSRRSALLQDLLRTTLFKLRNSVLGQGSIIIVTGTGRHVTREARLLLQDVFGFKPSDFTSNPKSLKTVWQRRVLIEDVFALSQAATVHDEWRGKRKVLWLVGLEDPSTSVCTVESALTAEFADALDYGFERLPDGTLSFTALGVLDRWLSLSNLVAEMPSDSVLRLHSEELKNRSPDTIGKVAQFVGCTRPSFPNNPRPSRLTEQNPAFRVVLDSGRVRSQFNLFPEIQPFLEPTYSNSFAEAAEEDAPNLSLSGTVIGFYTPDAVYRREAARLEKNLESIGMKHQLQEVKPSDNWVRTTLLKAGWIAAARRSVRGPLLYLDVDAFVHVNPWRYLLDAEADIAAVYNDGYLNSATIYIADTPEAQSALDEWVAGCQARLESDRGTLRQIGEDSDQSVLQEIVDSNRRTAAPSFSFRHLPQTMAYIFDNPQNRRLVGPVFIEQLQASRESREETKRLARRRDRITELEQ